jgi:hypothetical protein
MMKHCGPVLVFLYWIVALAGTSAAVPPAAQVPIRGDGASALAAADFNGDGLTDLAVANRSANTIAVYIRQSDGNFPAAPTRLLSSAVKEVLAGRRALIAAALNRGGKTDLILANSLANTVEVFRGRGDGTFLEPTTITTIALPTGLAVADFNRDTYPDLAIVSQGANKVRILRGKANGDLEPGGDFAAGSQPTSIVAGDFGSGATDAARDGYLDLAVTATGEGHINVLFGDGAGGFSAPVSYTSQAGTAAIVAADFNGDGVVDLATANADAHAVGVNLGIGKGKLGSFEGATIAATADFGSGIRPVGLAAADFDGDGKPDLAVAVEGAMPERSGVFLLLNRLKPRLRYVIFDPPVFCATGSMPVALTAADFRRAGAANDLAIFGKDPERVALLFADGKGGLTNCASPQQLSAGPGGTKPATNAAP